MPRFRRPPRRIGPRRLPVRRRPLRPLRPLAPGPMQALARANRMFAEGRFAEAAGQFERLGEGARAQKMRVAPRLFVQAARANWHAGDFPHGMQLLHTGLDILMTAGAFDIARRIAQTVIGELEELKRSEEAGEIKEFLEKIPAAAEGKAVAGKAPAKGARPVLPTHCNQCGAVVRPDEVEWMDEQTAECAYCGSPIRPEKA